jgi:hypothetical protein
MSNSRSHSRRGREEPIKITIQIEPTGPVYDAFLELTPPWWITHEKSLLIGLMLIICILGATMIGWAVTKNNAIKHEMNSEPATTNQGSSSFFANDDTIPHQRLEASIYCFIKVLHIGLSTLTCSLIC